MNSDDRSAVEHFVRQLSLGKLQPDAFVKNLQLLHLEENDVTAANKAAWFALAAAECRMDLARAESNDSDDVVTRCKRHVEMFDDMTKIMLSKL